MSDPDCQSKLPIAETFAPEYLEYYRMLPLERVGECLRVAVAGEPHPEAIADLEQLYGAPAELVPVSGDELREALRRLFAASGSVVELVRDLGADAGGISDPADDHLADARNLANQPPVIRFVNLLIREAYDAGASDIHLEALRDGLQIRFRIDGVLQPVPSPPAGLHAAIISRVKLLAELDIAERRAPQDGRIRVRLESRELDLRVSTVPTLHGESVVLRLLDRGGRPVTLDELGMAPAMLETFRRLVERPHGIVLATGPTGSGKTTTLYAALGLRRGSAEKILTVEDPVEYHLPGITQVPVHARAGVTFAAALRSILRQDPDVLMVGEMRDAETAGIAIQAAMTGHLVFSTLHTNDAVRAIARLVDLKVEPYMVAAALEGVLAQRLVRRVCPACVEPYRPDPAMIALLAGRPIGAPTLQRGAGCGECRGTGFRGRIGVFELFIVTEMVKQQLVYHALDLGALRSAAQEQGMTTLRQDAWMKVQAGLTTVEEVLRVVQD